MIPYHWIDINGAPAKQSISQCYYSKVNEFKDFEHKTTRYFPIENGGAAFYKESVTMPQEWLWTDDKVDKEMTVHRVNLKQNASLVIVFNKLDGNRLRVSISKNVQQCILLYLL